MLGVFMLVLVNNSLIILHVSTTWQRVAVGAIIIVATGVTAWRDRKRAAYRKQTA
jgi:simple sugar transport system permease protein